MTENMIPGKNLLELENEIKELWLEFGDVPMDPETEELEYAWNGFPAHTHREEIWQWFEETYHISVTDLLYGFDDFHLKANEAVE